MKVLVVFTYGYSLKTWFESGTIERELSIYRELQKFQHKFIFLTYGDELDENILKMILDLRWFNLQIYKSFKIQINKYNQIYRFPFCKNG